MTVSEEGPQVEIGPWLSKYPLPRKAGIVTVTKDMAGDWLDYRCRPGTAHQRKKSAKKVNEYTEIMDAGGWRTNPQGLIADTDGWLFNGQHRLQALRNSKKEALDFWVFPNESSAELFPVIDTPMVRQPRQMYNGEYATMVTSAVRYLTPGTEGRYLNTMPLAAVLERVSAWPELVTHARDVHAVGLRARVPASAHLAVLAQAERTCHRDDIAPWLEGLMTGFNIPTGDGRGLLRNHFADRRGRLNPELTYKIIAKAWNLYVSGEKLQILRAAAQDKMPVIKGYTPLGQGVLL